MHQHFENWNDMKHEPRKFWSAETIFLIYAKLFPYKITNGESQTPLVRFLLRGGGSVHRLELQGHVLNHHEVHKLMSCVTTFKCISNQCVSKLSCHFIFSNFILLAQLFYLQHVPCGPLNAGLSPNNYLCRGSKQIQSSKEVLLQIYENLTKDQRQDLPLYSTNGTVCILCKMCLIFPHTCIKLMAVISLHATEDSHGISI